MKISFVGDISLHGLFVEDSDKNIDRLEEASNYLSSRDFVFANLEAIIQGKSFNPLKKDGTGGVLLASTKEVVEECLACLNIGAVSLANNHIFDYEEDGVRQTIELLTQLGIKYTGAGLSESDIEPCIIKKNDERIAFMAYVDKETNPKIPDDRIFVNYLDEKKIISDIKEVRRNVDRIVLSLHWGIDYTSYPSKRQIQLAHKFIDVGVNVIMGHHAHNLQPYENYDKAHIFYGLGSLCFGDYLQEGERRALRLATKKSIIATIDTKTQELDCVKTKEQIGNYVRVLGRWKNKGRNILKIRDHFVLIKYMLVFKNAIYDRFVDFFFGYYRTPIRDMISLRNWRKLRYIIEDLISFNR